MEFGNNLNYFMWAFNLKNGDLAKALFVDPSLVSKWRTGRRVPKDDSIYQIAEALVSLCETEPMRQKLCYLLNLTYSSELFSEKRTAIASCLYSYMYPQGAKSRRSAEPPSFSDSSAIDAIPGESTQVFLGNEGYRDCLLSLLNEATTRGAPFRVYFLTTDSVNWLLDDEAFFQKWKRALQSARIAISSFHLIYHQSHNIEKGKSYVRAWAPFKQLPNYQTYHLAIRQDTHRVFNQTMMIIPSVGACIGTNMNHSQNRYMFLTRDNATLQKLERDFSLLLSQCICAFDSQEMDYAQMSARFQMDTSLANCRDVEIYANHLPILTLPSATLGQMLERSGFPEEKIASYLNAHESLQRVFSDYLDNKYGFELLVYLPRSLKLADMVGKPLPHSETYFGKEIFCTEEDVLSHIEATLDLVTTCRPFHLYLVEQYLYPSDLFIGYNSFLMEYDCTGGRNLRFSYQQNYINDVLAYIGASVRSRDHELYTRKRTVARLMGLRGSRNES